MGEKIRITINLVNNQINNYHQTFEVCCSYQTLHKNVGISSVNYEINKTLD